MDKSKKSVADHLHELDVKVKLYELKEKIENLTVEETLELLDSCSHEDCSDWARKECCDHQDIVNKKCVYCETEMEDYYTDHSESK